MDYWELAIVRFLCNDNLIKYGMKITNKQILQSTMETILMSMFTKDLIASNLTEFRCKGTLC